MEDRTIQVPMRVIDSTHRVGFFKRVQEASAHYPTMSAAYESVENDLERYGMPRRYSCYNSFRKQYWLWVRECIGSMEEE